MPFCQFCGKTLLNEGDRCGCAEEREILGEGDIQNEETSVSAQSDIESASGHEPINRKVAKMLGQQNVPGRIESAGEPTLILNKNKPDGAPEEKPAKNKALIAMIAAASVVVVAGVVLLVLYGLGYIGGREIFLYLLLFSQKILAFLLDIMYN